MKRILMVLTVTAMLAVMVAVSALPAAAGPPRYLCQNRTTGELLPDQNPGQAKQLIRSGEYVCHISST